MDRVVGWAATGTGSRPFVGRERERALLDDLLVGLTADRPGVLLVHGEAGVGKTRLLEATVEEARERGIEVLRGTCVHFTTSVVPYGALMLAVRSWQAERGRALPDDFARLLASADPTRQAETVGSASMLTALDDVLRTICSERPVLLVVDDLQWADNASLDFLAFVIAGLGGQRLGLLLAYRDEDRRGHDALEQWLGDTGRMPNVQQHLLERLDREDTALLVSTLLDRATTPELAGAVYSRTRGNAYFTELLVRHLTPDGDLPTHLPDDLTQAVAARWKTMSVPARELTRLVALGGGPVDGDVLPQVVTSSAPWLGPASPLVAEGVAAGVLTLSRAGRVWFRHPLLAELLAAVTTRVNPRTVHGAYAAAIEERIRRHGETPGSVAAAALHHHAAGHVDLAFAWAVRAATEAERLSAWTVADDALERACALWPDVSASVQAQSPGLLALLRRAAKAARRSGALDRRLAYLARARECVDEETEPLLASTVLIDWCTSSWDAAPHGRQTILPEVFQALALTEGAPDSPERAVALAELAIARVWNEAAEPGDDRGGVVTPGWAASRAALEVAQRSRASEAMARAHCAAGIVEFYDEGSAALTHLQDAYGFAAEVGDALTMGSAAIYWTNYLQYQSRLVDSATLCRHLSAEVLAAGDAVISTFLAGAGAGILLSLGDWDECRRLLRPALAAGRLTFGGATASTVMSSLSTRTGDFRQAQAHVDRMLELVDPSWVGWSLDRPIVELQLARGDPRSALATLRDRYERVEWRDQQGDLHTALGASAAADLAQEARDRQDATAEGEALAALEEMLGYGAELGRHPRARIDDPVTDRSWRARLRAEVARCRRDHDEPEAWEAAMLVNQECGFRWDEALSGWRFGQALMRSDGARSRANEPLRRAHRLATGLGAVPLTREIEALARTADLSLQEVVPPRPQAAGPAGSVLSEREREVLAHVDAGRTNAEIARALFISEKTASVHVSNILRKTGTHSRVEAAAWGRRTGELPAPDAE
jgi:DNA-binding CsgD family transcriptional regulator